MMSRTTKGVLAAVAAGVLLLGGIGSIAYWTSTQTVTGGTINAGHLALVVDGTNTGCGAWTIDTGETGPAAYTPGDPLVPGDVLSRECNFTLDAEGLHMRGNVTASAPTLTGTLAGALSVSATDLKINNVATSSFTEANDGQKLTTTVTVTFTDPGTADNTYNQVSPQLTAALGNIAVTATQIHS
jgi:alternate signal-mediated exported protein